MIEILHLKKEYPTITPIKDLSVTINQGDVISVIGPSGCGKSTLLRMINMLERPTAGQIIVDGEDITVPNYPLNKLRQKVGMVFQSYNLFNHMTVIENICYAPIQLKGMDPESAYEKGMSLLADVGLSNFALSYPKTLSGGQKQRVAIARTLAMDPEIILFDEPTSALDPTMVGEVENVIKRLAGKGLTIMMVTHDMNFAERLPNRVFYLDEGGLYEDGTPKQIFKNPQKPKTIAFIKKFREFNCIIDSSNYDFMSLYTQIDQFAYRNDIPRKEKEKILAVFEELCFGIFKPQLKEEGTNVEFSIVYSDLLKDSRLSAKWNGFEIDLKDPKYKLEFGIIEHFSKSIKQEEPNSVRIKIKDE